MNSDRERSQENEDARLRGGGSTTAHNSDARSQGGLEGRGEDQIDVDDQWAIINAFFDQNGVVNQQI